MKAVFGTTATTTTPVNKRKNLGRIAVDQQHQKQTKTKQQWFDVQVSIERTRRYHHHHHQQHDNPSHHRSRGRGTQRARARSRDDRLAATNDESNHDLNSNNVLPISNSQSDLDDDNESINSTSSVIHVSSLEHNFYDDDDDSQRKQDSNLGDEDVSVDRIMNNDDYDSDDSSTTRSTTTPFMNCLLRVDQQQKNKKEPPSLTQILSLSPSKKFSSSVSASSSAVGDGGGGGDGGAIISITRKSLNQQRRMFEDSFSKKRNSSSTVLPPPLPTPCSFDLPSSTTSGDLIPVENNNNDDDPSKDAKSLIAPEHRKKSRTFDECDGEDILRSATTIKNRNDATPLIKNTNRYYEDEEEEQQCQSCHSASTTGTAGTSRKMKNGGDASTSVNGIISKSNSSSVNSLLNTLEQDDQRSSNLNNDRVTTSSSRERSVNTDHELMKFHLTTLDELHVIPCQCALSLMGMRGTTLLFASPESSTASFGGTNHDNVLTNAPLPGLDERDTSSSSSRITNSFMGWLFSSSSSSKKQEDDSLTRTVSGHHHHHYLNGANAASNNNKQHGKPSSKNNDKKDHDTKTLRKRNKNKQPALFEIDHTDQYPSTMSINALHRTTPSISKKLHKRSFSNTFVSVQYHEIVLFNMSSSVNDCGNDADESSNTWNTITIRCDDHDTMDEIVRTLKRASNCKVIPFSTNSRLEEARQVASQQRKQHRRQQRQRQQQHEEQIIRRQRKQQQQSTPTSTTDKQLLQQQPKSYLPSSLSSKRESEYSSDRPIDDDQLRTDLLVPQVGMSVSEDTHISEEENDHFSLEDSTIHSKEMDGEGSTFLPSIAFTTPVRRLSLLSTSSSRRDRRTVVLPSKLGASAGSNKKNWNMAEECEFCGLHFTLLSRRHHCRKCSCSCCEDCSIVVFLSAKEETRLCNRCNSKELVLNTPQRIPNTTTGRIRQGTALRSVSTDERGRSQRKQHRKFSDSMTLCLLGKVHEGCSTYGVAVMGMLPHWKHYLHFDKRPAVGRITVEIVEALSLKRIDLNLKCNPYVRATITGYDYDLEHNLVEWQQQFTLMTSYCSSTLSPVWRGPGKMGGQLLTLPVLSTCGAVLRLEILHFDQITNAAGVDSVIGIVEIPLSDLPNANLRNKDSIINNNTGARRSSSSTTYAEDGFVDRWYHLEEPLQVPPSTKDSSSTSSSTAAGIFEPDASRDRILSSATSHRMSAYLAKPVSNPLVQPQQQQHSTKKGPTTTSSSSTTAASKNETMEEGFKANPIVKKWLRTMDEVNQWGENAIKVPMEWIGAALVGLDPSNKSKTKPNPLTSITANTNTISKATTTTTATSMTGTSTTTETSNGISSSSQSRKLDSSNSNRRRSVIHVRIKLNVSETGDLMSHSWFPPMIRPYPKRPTFDPNTTYRRILFILQKADPYLKFLKLCEKCLKWKKPTKTCFQFYFTMIFHVFWFHQLIYLVHIYLIGYFSYRFHGMMQQQKHQQRQATRSLDKFASTDGSAIDGSTSQQRYKGGSAVVAESSNNRCYMDGSRSSFTSNLDDDISLRSSSTTASKSGRQQPPSRRDFGTGTSVQETNDDSSMTNNSAGLNKIIVWAAKKWLSSRGMDSLQYKLGLLASNVTKLNTTWDGSDSRVTAGTIVILTTSFVLHILCNVRHLWILFITIGYFGPSPLLQKIIRFILGFYKGCLKVLRRRHLHVLEQQQQHH